MNEQKNKFNYEYLIGLIMSFIPIFFVKENNNSGIFWFSTIILIMNLFHFITIRYKAIKLSGNLILNSLALAVSIWLFLHCLFQKYTASQEFIVFLTRQNKGMVVFNGTAFSFFMASIILLITTIIDVLRSKSQLLKIINFILIGGSCIIISMYIFIFPNIIISKPTIQLSKVNDELVAERRLGELFNSGKIVKGYKIARYEWYRDGIKIENGKIFDNSMKEVLQVRDTKGTFQVFISPPDCEKIQSNTINL